MNRERYECCGDSGMSDSIRLEQQPTQPLAIVRRRASRSQFSTVVPAACGTVWNVLRSQQVQGAGRHVAVYYFTGDGSEQVNLEIGVELATPFAGHGEVIPSATPAGTVVTTTHYGPYQQLHQAHTAIQRWCATHGHQLAGPCWEIYGHWQDAWNRDPSQICTEVCYRVAADKA